LTTGNLYNTELFLGDDNLYVKLANTGNIVVNANNNTGNSAQWNFSTNGTLTLPAGSSRITSYGQITIETDNNASGMYLNADGVNLLYANTNVTLRANSTGTNKDWNFDTTGNLTTPDGMIINGNVNTLGTQTALLQAADDLPLSFIASGANGTITSYWAEDFANLMASNIAAIYTPLQNTQTVRIVTGTNGGNIAIYDFDPDGMFTAAAVCATGNVYAGNVSASGNVTGSNLSVTGNVTGGNILTAGLISATGNVTGGNILTAGLISATGNITGNYILGNGSQLTGLPATYGNANVATFLAAYGSNTISTSGNVTAGNIIGNINITGNVQGTSSNVTLVAGSYSWTFDNTGNTQGNLSLTGADITINNAPGGNEGAEIKWALPSPANTVLSTSLVQDVFQNGMRFFEAGGNNRGLYMDLGNVPNGSTTAVGYRDIPQVSFTGNATLAATDAGRHYYSTLATANTLTIANNTSVSWSVGTAITVVNRGSGNITIAQGSGVSLYLAGNSTAANRTISTYGMATLLNVAANVWMINGTGVS
jgi:hypothetical protein